MFDLALYGNLSVNTVQMIDSYKEGFNNYGINSYREVGFLGSSINHLLYLDNNLSIKVLSQIGNDENGEFIRKHFNKLVYTEGIRVDSKQIIVSPTLRTTTSTTIYDKRNRIRTMVTNWGACRKKYSFPAVNTRWTHINSADTLVNLSSLSMKNMNGIISLNLLEQRFSPATKRRIFHMLPYIDYIILSKKKAKSLCDTDDDLKAAKMLHRKNNGIVILYEPNGAIIYDGTKASLLKNKNYHSKYEVNGVEDDVFVMTFIYDQLSGSKYIDSIVYAYRTVSSLRSFL